MKNKSNSNRLCVVGNDNGKRTKMLMMRKSCWGMT